MKRIVSIIGIFSILFIIALSFGAASAYPENKQDEITELKKEVLSLQKRVKELEERLERATIIFPQTKFRMPESIIKIPKEHLQPKYIPKGWQKFYFNGIPYYIIPIDQNSTCPNSND